MPKVPTKIPRLRPTKEVSVMAWIEDLDQNVLLVRQAAGLKLWTLPGCKVKRGESLLKALKREVYEDAVSRFNVTGWCPPRLTLGVRPGHVIRGHADPEQSSTSFSFILQ